MSVTVTPVASAKVSFTKIAIRHCELCTGEEVHESILAERRLNAHGHRVPSPLPGHREGLADNDPVTLDSALRISALIPVGFRL